jgi:IS5 family transposase
MGPLPSNPSSAELFRQPLIEMLSPKHPQVKLADVMDWPTIEHSFGTCLASIRGRPALQPQLVAGLLYMQHAYDCSDKADVNTWIENQYFRYFFDETYFQTELPIDPSRLTRWEMRCMRWRSQSAASLCPDLASGRAADSCDAPFRRIHICNVFMKN